MDASMTRAKPGLFLMVLPFTHVVQHAKMTDESNSEASTKEWIELCFVVSTMILSKQHLENTSINVFV